MSKKYDEWEVRNALDTLTRAEEIKKDKNLMKKVKQLSEQNTKAVTAAEILYPSM